MPTKANEEAVSPVIGVILMVAITVVLAAVVFTMVTRFGNTPESAPTVQFSTDDSGSTYYVVRASKNVAWQDLDVTGCTTHPTTGNVQAGQLLEGCSGPVNVSHTPTNTVIYRHD